MRDGLATTEYKTAMDLNMKAIEAAFTLGLYSNFSSEHCVLDWAAYQQVVMKATGMCRTCHLDQLIVLRETQLTEAIRERKLTSLRQNKHRLRICVICDRPFFPRPTSKAIKCEMCGGTE
jgi:hypothetical protein